MKDARYELSGDQSRSLTDHVSGKTYSFEIDDKMPEHLNVLVSKLVGVANKRVDGFDPLLNCLEALDAVFVFMKQAFPPLLTSGVLQPLVDLNAAVHDKVAGARPPLLDGRTRGLDGRYRRQNEYPEGSFKDEGGSDAPTRPVRLYRYMLEAFVLVAFDALLMGHNGEEAASELRKMIGHFGIRNQDYKASRLLLVREVVAWKKVVLQDQDRPAAARAYCYRELRELYATELRLCSDRVKGRLLAGKTLERVRTHQFSYANSSSAD